MFGTELDLDSGVQGRLFKFIVFIFVETLESLNLLSVRVRVRVKIKQKLEHPSDAETSFKIVQIGQQNI